MKNFRALVDSTGRETRFNPRLTLFVGENDFGKSAIVDALKIVLGTTDLGWYRIKESDFRMPELKQNPIELAFDCFMSRWLYL
ncbi:MAG TPA: AAA family ATPase [Bacillales bacterium]|nr:AAA family ATPase [Bacillales bacterium]